MLLKDPAFKELHITRTPILTGFSIQSEPDRRSSFSFLLWTDDGLQFKTFLLDKRKAPWEVSQKG
jgi:hypothetical protein